MNSPIVVAVAIGSNLGDRFAHLAFARERLAHGLDNLQFSSSYETDPVDVPGVQGPFLNAAAVATTTAPAQELLDLLLAIERERGRARPYPGAARTLDLDLVLYGDLVASDEVLTVPHPRFRDRRFVLEPLAEIAPALRDPVTTLTVAELLARLPPTPAARRL